MLSPAGQAMKNWGLSIPNRLKYHARMNYWSDDNMPKPVEIKQADNPTVVQVAPPREDDSWKVLLFIGGAVVIFIVLGIVILRGSLASSSAYESSYMVKQAGGGTDMAYYPNNIVYKPRPTDFNWIGALLFLSGLVYLIYLGNKVTKDSKHDLEVGLALFGSAMLVAGVIASYGLVSFMQNYEQQGIAETLRYGWLIENVIFCVVGLASLWIASRIDERKNIIDALPINLTAPLFFIFATILFGFSLHDAIARGAVELEFIQRFGALVASVIFYMAAYLLLALQKGNSPEEYHENRILLKLFGYPYLFATFVVFVFGLMNLLNGTTIELSSVLKWLGESLAYGAIGAAYLFYADRLGEPKPQMGKAG